MSPDKSLLYGERRSFPRHPVQQPVLVASPVGASQGISGVTRDVSGSGVFIIVNHQIAVGSSIELLFDMPTQAGDGYYPVRCVGTVVRVESCADKAGLAIAFQKVENTGSA